MLTFGEGWYAYVLIMVLFGVSSVAGVGGGVILLPLLLSLLQAETKEAIALTSAIVVESALIRFVFFSAWKGHPNRGGGTEIDYNMATILYPAFLIGSFLGVIASIAASEFILTVLLIGIMGFFSVQTLIKAVSLYKAES